jgi:hypothetical protein
MKFKAVILGLAAVAAMIASTGRASALDASSTNSDQNLRYTRAYLEHALDALSHDQTDYGGHRVQAISDLQTARTDLTAALKFDQNPDDATLPTDVRPQDSDISSFLRGQAASNQSIANSRTVVERAISMLQDDAHDYGGFRVKAMGALSAARDQLTAALAFVHDNGNGGMNVGSDDNLRFSRLYLNRAVDMLQHDARDYAGHRVAAITDIQRAQADLTSALEHDSNRDRDQVLPTRAAPGDEDLDTFFTRGDFKSDQNISFVSRYVERTIDMLQKDQHDYAGFRAKAVSDLVAARQELSAALSVH